MKGFKVKRFIPFNENVFTNDELLAATVIDRLMLHVTDFNKTLTSGTAVTDNIIAQCSSLNLLHLITRIETVGSRKKVQARKMSNGGQRKWKSRILTNTPVKLIIMAEKKPKRKKHTEN